MYPTKSWSIIVWQNPTKEELFQPLKEAGITFDYANDQRLVDAYVDFWMSRWEREGNKPAWVEGQHNVFHRLSATTVTVYPKGMIFGKWITACTETAEMIREWMASSPIKYEWVNEIGEGGF